MSKIKTMKLIIIKFTAFLILTTLSSCGIDMLNRIEGNNNVISVKRDINEDFTKVKGKYGYRINNRPREVKFH